MAAKAGVLTGGILPLGAGLAGGVMLNDIWEGALTNGVPLPGYGQKLFSLTSPDAPTQVGVGMDDVFQAGIGAAVAILGGSMGSPFIKNLGIGLIGGWGLAKAGEFMPAVESSDGAGTYFRNPISIIPHRYPIVPSGAVRSAAVSGCTSCGGSYNVNIS